MKNKGTLKKVLGFLGHYRLYMLLSMILATVSVGLSLYVPILVGNAIDVMIDKGAVQFDTVIYVLIKIALATGISALCQWIMNLLNNKITYEIVRDVRNAAFSKILKLPFSYLDRHMGGELVSRIIADADQFADGLLMGFSQFFTGVATIIGTLIFMLTIDIKTTLIVVIFTPLSLFAAKFIANRTYSMFRLQSETRGEQTAFVEEMIGGQKTVQAFSREEASLNTFEEINNRLSKASLKATFFSSMVNPSTRFINNLVYAAVALCGAVFAIAGGITVGGLTSILSYARQYSKPFNEISSVVTELQNALACAQRVFEIIDEPAEIPDASNAISLNDVSGRVALEKVFFSYTKDRPLIENLNLSVESGKRIAIVGPTGCGKTTLINLLMRFYDVDSGEISVDGVDIRNCTRESLRKNWGMVLQETWLKTATVRENIAMGKPDATLEEVIAAAKSAHAHSFIKRMKDGYDTLISDGGSNLSAGQRQLICIARIMLMKPPMLILDEATSSIDSRTEIKINDAFLRLIKGKTSFIVAHRLSTICDADEILVMRDGKIIETGNHESLLEKGGFYSTLYNSQFADN